MRFVHVVSFALSGVLGTAPLAASRHARGAHSAREQQSTHRTRAAARSSRSGVTSAASRVTVGSDFSALPALRFTNQNTRQSAEVKLYDAVGHVDENEAMRLDELLCDSRDASNWSHVTLDRRTLQLAVRAALHFQANELQVVSAYRKPGRHGDGPHATGKAVDFKLPGVAPGALASYLRTLPRTGVGIYTHPKTSFVHLDDRLQSFHWLDASPPGRHWREVSMGEAGLHRLDESYRRADDWPEGTTPPRDQLP